MIFCKYCDHMLDDDAKFCENCGKPVENDDLRRQDTTYQVPVERKIDIKQLIFAIINFTLVGIFAIWPLIHVMNARKAPDDATESFELAKAKRANQTLLALGLIIVVIETFAGILMSVLQ